MPRQARLDAPGTLHHMMIRGIEGKSIFRDNRDRKEFVTRLGNLTKETGTLVLGWSLLRNHVYPLLFSGPSGLALFMRRLLTGWAQGVWEWVFYREISSWSSCRESPGDSFWSQETEKGRPEGRPFPLLRFGNPDY